jgi:hypothetical protein
MFGHPRELLRMAKYRRSIRLIQPRLQLKLVLTFLGMAMLAMTLQFLLLAAALVALAGDLPNDGLTMQQELPERLMWILGLSFGVCLPLIFCVGVVITFRIAGPLYRFEKFLDAVKKGEKPADCRLRKGDELQDFCVLLNDATAPLRRREAEAQPQRLDAAA